jgi:hypothetical protein
VQDAARLKPSRSEQLARFVGFLVALAAAVLTLPLVMLAEFSLDLYQREHPSDRALLWLVVLFSGPLVTVGVYVLGWMRDWSVLRSVALSMAGVCGVVAAVAVGLITAG